MGALAAGAEFEDITSVLKNRWFFFGMEELVAQERDERRELEDVAARERNQCRNVQKLALEQDKKTPFEERRAR